MVIVEDENKKPGEGSDLVRQDRQQDFGGWRLGRLQGYQQVFADSGFTASASLKVVVCYTATI